MTDGTTTWSYSYDADGLRTGKTDGTTSYSYVYNGGQLSQMTVTTQVETDGQTTTETHTVDLTYDASGNPQTMTYDGTTYYYTVNIQGDVTGIVDESGNVLVRYNYQAYGTTYYYGVPTNSVGTTLRQINPLTYRGYVYDKETKLYYLQSRYYSRTTGRFINADAFTSTGQGLLGNNMFAYCLNNPANGVDPTGCRPENGLILFEQVENRYITDQRDPSVGYMRFGLANVSHSGCGIVATYNALISMGDYVPFEEVLEYYNQNIDQALIYGLAGLPPKAVVQYFRSKGYIVINTDNPMLMDFYSQYADACILWYAYTTDQNPLGYGAHYVEYICAPGGCVGRNTNQRITIFEEPSTYGYSENRFYARGIFIFKKG